MTTVKELIKELSAYDSDAPVLVTTHYDNDTAYSPLISVSDGFAEHMEAHYYDSVDTGSRTEDNAESQNLPYAVFISA